MTTHSWQVVRELPTGNFVTTSLMSTTRRNVRGMDKQKDTVCRVKHFHVNSLPFIELVN